AWNFTGAGDGSGIYKSIDGGENWKKINTGKNGFPSNEGVGRIGLDISRSNSNIIYAILDNQNRRPKTETEVYVVTKELLSKIDRESFLELSDLEINNYLNRNNFPQQYNATDIKKAVETKKITPNTLVEYLQDANAALFDTPVIGAEIYKSEDAGKTWEKMNKDYLDGVYNSYGYYFGQIRISPQNPDKIYTFGVPVIKSADSGKSWESINGGNVHVDHHALWLNPQKKGHLILGNDGGVNISYDDGNTWIKCNNAALGQFYAVNVDMETPYNVYGGLQDNGVWMGPHNNVTNNNWQMEGAYPFQELLGGDGMQVAIDTRDNNIVYTGFQFGYYYRIYKNTGEKKLIQPKHKLGERPLRFNWQVPIHLSKHNQDILYLGSNKFHRSFNKGDDFEALSGDLTKGGKKGNVPYGTLTDIHESPLKFGLIYTGTDDGLVHVSKDGGYTWENISNGLPKDMWISRVTASAFKESRVYVSLNGYRFDNFSAMVFVSEDYGKTWQSIGNDLPAEPVNVIIEDTENNNLLYVGTDHGLYISLNRGKSFMAAGKSIPNVPIHDLVIHPREHHLIVGTHGRSIYVGDISEIQQLTTEVTSKEIDIFAIDNMKYSKQWGNEKGYAWRGYHEPKLLMPFYSKNAGEVTITIVSEKEQILKTERVNAVKGLNYFEYDLSIERKEIEKYKIDFNTLFTSSEIEMNKKKNGKFYLVPSTYVLQIKINDHSATQKFVIEPPKKQSERKPTQKTP
ncbi:MAG: glycosyl hydrolase, partial [Bacteroidota bacterium]